MSRHVLALLFIASIFIVACGSESGDNDVDMADAADVEDMQLDEEMDADMRPDVDDLCNASYVVGLPTDDGLTLEADLHTAGVGGPAVVLLHMAPPTNDRTNWPDDLIAQLVASGVTVLNVDRRGTAASGGLAEEAANGPNGVLDAKAAFDFLAYSECLIDIDRIVWVGASNGTTTVLDFAVLASEAATLSTPAGLAMLSPGDYTENQHVIDDIRTVVEPLPTLFLSPTSELTWPEQYVAGAPSSWEFIQIDTTAHGTAMFAADPTTAEVLVGFVDHTVN